MVLYRHSFSFVISKIFDLRLMVTVLSDIAFYKSGTLQQARWMNSKKCDKSRYDYLQVAFILLSKMDDFLTSRHLFTSISILFGKRAYSTERLLGKK